MNEPLAEALERLPHGPGFRFIDRLLTLHPGRSGEATYRVKGDEPFLSGHFPGQPIFPGVLLVEAGAQLGGIVAQSDPEIAPLKDLRLTSIRSVKITGTARPGEIIHLHALITGRLGNLVQAQVKAAVEGMIVMQGEVTLSGEAQPVGG